MPSPQLVFDSIDAFIAHQSQLLQLEHAEQKRTEQECLNLVSPKILQQRGLALLNLKLTGQRSGLSGKTLLELEPLISKEFVSHTLRVGDSAQLSPHGSSALASEEERKASALGVIYKLNESKLVIALDEHPLFIDSASSFRVIKTADDVTFKRLQKALSKLAKTTTGWMAKVIKANNTSSLALTRIPSVASPYASHLLSDRYYYSKSLNDSQKSAVMGALNAGPLFLIHGPPGTGKTATLVEIVRQLLCPQIPCFQAHAEPLRILVCGPSNLSVDNLVERLTHACPSPPLRLVRLGHPARLIDTILPWTLDSQYRNSNQGLVSRELRVEMDAILKSLSQPFSATASRKEGAGSKKQLYAELRTLRAELKSREKSGLESFLHGFQIVAATCAGSGSNSLYHSLLHHQQAQFDLVIIDEAAQALEMECWIPMLLSKKVILAGDHCQLSPTVICKEADRQGLSTTLFDRLMQRQPSAHAYSALLTVQYRMHALISDWSSTEMYDGALRPDASVAQHRLSDLSNPHAYFFECRA